MRLAIRGGCPREYNKVKAQGVAFISQKLERESILSDFDLVIFKLIFLNLLLQDYKPHLERGSLTNNKVSTFQHLDYLLYNP